MYELLEKHTTVATVATTGTVTAAVISITSTSTVSIAASTQTKSACLMSVPTYLTMLYVGIVEKEDVVLIITSSLTNIQNNGQFKCHDS